MEVELPWVIEGKVRRNSGGRFLRARDWRLRLNLRAMKTLRGRESIMSRQSRMRRPRVLLRRLGSVRHKGFPGIIMKIEFL